ncbi:MAG: ABC transporter permease [Christensenellales bacterium]
MHLTTTNVQRPQSGFRRWCAIAGRDLRVNKSLYMIAIPMLVYYALFHYVPMYGITIAFKDYKPVKGIFDSAWVGLKHFDRFINGQYFFRLIRNTFLLSFFSFLFGFPAPILLALLLNEIHVSWFKRTVQTITYMPHFISMVVICGMIRMFTTTDGILSDMMKLILGDRLSSTNLLIVPRYFRTIYVISGVWQGIGWGSIIYLSAISSIDQAQYESAIIDGAGRFAQAIYITIPGIAPTIIIRMILRVGDLMTVGFEKVLLLYNEATWVVSDVISTYVYREGLLNFNYSFSTAVNLFNTVINLIFLLSANWISARYSETSLF